MKNRKGGGKSQCFGRSIVGHLLDYTGGLVWSVVQYYSNHRKWPDLISLMI